MKNLIKNINQFVVLLIVLVLAACNPSKKKSNEDAVTIENETSNRHPNVLLIYMDDLGYGDVSAYGVGTLETPNIDRIAKNGIRFTNGYATSATCTPSRYAILSGEYPWKNQKARILPGNAPLLFDTSKETLPSMLKKAEYTTAVIGKWHLGLGGETMDWNTSIKPGPNEIGFDYSYILASTNDRVPSVYVENDRVVGLDPADSLKVSYQENFPGEPTGRENPELLKLHPSHGHDMSVHNGISRIGYMKGGKSALFIDEDMSDTIMVRTKNFIKSNKDNPFFLFYSLHQPHVPRVPHPRFEGSSGMGPRGDAILEADWAIGQVLDQLDELGIAENTIVIFSSDNGPVLDDGYIDDANEKLGDHTPRGGLRGGKYSMLEAGTRVPFLVSWPGKIKPGVSDALVCQLDFMGSLASLIGLENPSTDSQDTLEAFLGTSDKGRDELVLEATGKIFFRKGNWVMIPPHKGPKITNKWVRNETGNSEDYQLYNLDTDLGQQKNLASEHPEKVEKMLKTMKGIEGR
ncbi:sulfatase family protein [Flagellimonas onchidii]|uniref:sulfatase family protein n=1 Tax=Flagellimonas onchidii TaxID=2562684 RepID=UPI0010A69044|nr:arylsulfatase [Allomuricauda onchidii]